MIAQDISVRWALSQPVADGPVGTVLAVLLSEGAGADEGHDLVRLAVLLAQFFCCAGLVNSVITSSRSFGSVTGNRRIVCGRFAGCPMGCGRHQQAQAVQLLLGHANCIRPLDIYGCN